MLAASSSVVVPAAGATAGAAERERLAGYKVPKQVHVVEAIPKSPVGKVLRRALRDPLWAGVDREQRA